MHPVWLGRAALHAVTIAVVAGLAIAIGLAITPMQTVEAAGQTVRVGAAAPTLSWSGPGELDLFGQHLPTTIEFVGPVRPRIELTRITLSQQLAELVGAGTTPGQLSAAKTLQDGLVAGWTRYFAWQVSVTGAAALVLLAAIAGWRRYSLRSSVALVVAGLVITEAVNLGAIMLTAYTAPQRLRQIDSLQALVGAAPPPALPATQRRPRPDGDRIVVIGDSIAAGLGNPPLPNADEYDQACQRSVDSFPNVLDVATHWTVTNLGCSGARIRDGLLGPQQVGQLSIPPQLSAAVARAPAAIVVNIGANDVNWSALLRACAAKEGCHNVAEQAYFQQQLTGFTRDYFVLLTQLRAVFDGPVVVVNLYYNPFGGAQDCLTSVGIDKDKVRTLVARLDALNTVLAGGATATGFSVMRPNFAGHGLCSSQPYVQGIDDAAPLHPTTAGALAIALTLQQQLRDAGLRPG